MPEAVLGSREVLAEILRRRVKALFVEHLRERHLDIQVILSQPIAEHRRRPFGQSVLQHELAAELKLRREAERHPGHLPRPCGFDAVTQFGQRDRPLRLARLGDGGGSGLPASSTQWKQEKGPRRRGASSPEDCTVRSAASTTACAPRQGEHPAGEHERSPRSRLWHEQHELRCQGRTGLLREELNEAERVVRVADETLLADEGEGELAVVEDAGWSARNDVRSMPMSCVPPPVKVNWPTGQAVVPTPVILASVRLRPGAVSHTIEFSFQLSPERA